MSSNKKYTVKQRQYKLFAGKFEYFHTFRVGFPACATPRREWDWKYYIVLNFFCELVDWSQNSLVGIVTELQAG
jgi:hypothetical protein